MRRVPFQIALSSLLVVTILLTSTVIGVLAYVSSSTTVELLWTDLSEQIADVAVEKTLRYLESGHSALAMNRRMVDTGLVDLTDRPATLAYLLEGLRSHPNITWNSLGLEDGTFLSVYRRPDGVLRVTWRELEAPGRSHYRDFDVQDDGTWLPVRDDYADYDPRVRPWYRQALESEAPIWTRPYIFLSRNQPGFTLAQQHRAEDGTLIGVWAMEYEMSFLSEFLERLAVVESGRTYLVTGDGRVIGHPDGWTSDSEDGEVVVASAEGHRDTLLAAAFARSRELGSGAQRFELNHGGRVHLAVFEPFPVESGLDWSVAIILPEEDILGQINRSNRINALFAVLAALGTILLGAWITRRVSRPLRAIASDLVRIGRLDLEQTGAPINSRVREVNEMVVARDQMRGGLTSFAKYVPADLVRSLMASGQEAILGGETRELTCYFSDIAGFTSIAERLKPDELVELLAVFLGDMSDLIAAEDGTVDKYIGDAIMAFWGAPRPHKEHAAAACRAALACQARLAELRTGWREAGQPELYTRIGLNTGAALVGNIGSTKRMNYTVMGDPVNLASRLEGLCKIYGVDILIGPDTQAQAGHAFVTRRLDRVAVKGRAQGSEVYELVGLAGDVDRAHIERIESYESALEAYQERRFADAVSGFGAVLEAHPSDTPATLLLRQAGAHLAEPPPEDWDGVTVMKTKG